jgi:hypothetical protein
MLAIYIDAGHTGSGNPKRGWIITDDQGNFTDFVDEGYSGRSAMKEAGYDCPSTPCLKVAGSVYRDLQRDANRKRSR